MENYYSLSYHSHVFNITLITVERMWKKMSKSDRVIFL